MFKGFLRKIVFCNGSIQFIGAGEEVFADFCIGTFPFEMEPCTVALVRHRLAGIFPCPSVSKKYTFLKTTGVVMFFS